MIRRMTQALLCRTVDDEQASVAFRASFAIARGHRLVVSESCAELGNIVSGGRP